MAESESPSKLGIEIPYFYYDIIARIAPGAFLIAGVLLSWDPRFLAQRLSEFLDGAIARSMSAGLAALLVGTGLFALWGISAFVGFLLGSLSHEVVERGLWHWRKLTLTGLSDFIGARIDFLKNQFQIQFGSELTDQSLRRASHLCAFYVWRSDPGLGAMAARADAELLAAQSVLFVSLVLLVAVARKCFMQGFTPNREIWLATLFGILVSSVLTFDYHRQKRVYGRFALFLAVSNHPQGAESATPKA